MGREIVYCEACGRRLLEEEFSKFKAHFLDDKPYCTDCRPLPSSGRATTTRLKAPESARPRTPPPSGSLRPPKTSTSRMPKLTPQTTRAVRPQAGPSRTPLLIGAWVGGGALLIVLLALAFSSGGRGGGVPEPPAGEDSRVATTARAGAEPPSPSAAAIQNLEAYAAAGHDADSILVQCDRVRGALVGSPFEARLRRVEDAALRQREERRRGRQLETALEEIAKVREQDPGFAQEARVKALYASALEVAGARRAELAAQRDEYVKKAEAARSRARPKAGPYDLDAEGFVNDWLLLGPFPNPEDKEFYKDHLRTEEEHVPAPGVAVARADGSKATWAPYRTSGGLVEFAKVPHLGFKGEPRFVVTYAACRLECDAEVEVELRVGSDDGYRLWVDGGIEGTRHVHRGCQKDQEKYPLRLSAGLHPLLLKVDQGDGGYQFLLRVVTPQGRKPAGVRVWH